MTGFALRYKWLVVAAWSALLVLSIAVLGVRFMSKAAIIDNSVGIWFMKDDPELKVYEDFNRQFREREWSILLLSTDSVFDPIFLRDLAQITSRIEKVEHVTKVLSMTNVRDSEASAEGAISYPTLYPARGKDRSLSPQEIDEFKARLYRNPIFESSILHRADARTTAVLFQNDNFIHVPEPYRIEMVDAIKKVLSDYPRLRGYSLAGTSVINAELNRASRRDGIIFYIAVMVFIIVAAYASLRNLRDVAVVLSVVSASALPPMAALAALGIPYNMVTIMLPPVLITLSVCDVVHVINAFHFERQHLGPAPAIYKAIRDIWTPCMWTTVVTAVGFVSLTTSTVFPIWQLGFFSAIGIGLAWLMTMTCVPVLLITFWPRGHTDDTGDTRGAKPVGVYGRRLLPLHRGRYRWIWLAVSGCMVLSIYGIRKLDVDTNYTKFFGSGTYVTRAYPELAKAGFGQSPVSLRVRFPAGTTYASGEHIAKIARFQDEIRKDPAIIKLLTYTDLLERADLAFNGDDPTGRRLVTYNAQQIAQLYLMSEIGGNDDLRDFVADDKGTVQIIAMTPYMSSKELESFKARIDRAAKGTLPADVDLKVTGTTVQWANMDKEISHTQMSSLYVIGLVFLVLLPLVFRSLLLGVIGVFINALPMAITFGLMGLLDIKINLATALIGGVAIGATVDSTIFFINRVRLGLHQGLPWGDAVDAAVETVGDGIIMTSVILAGGFACLSLSSFRPTADFGGLVSFSIVVAAFMDVIVNPIVLRLVGGRRAHDAARSGTRQGALGGKPSDVPVGGAV